MEIRTFLDGRYAEAEKVVLVLDNLNTHTRGAPYEAFPHTEARRLAERVEFHYTPKHGSWLNIAENDLSALTTQCLTRRIGTLTDLHQEVRAWARQRNDDGVRVNWRFTIDRAREKLHRVYLQLQN